MEVGGVTIPAREFVGVPVLAANRDPQTFPDPLRFDIRRDNATQTLSFAYGIHAHLGIHLARLETQVAIQRIRDRLTGLELSAFDPPGGFALRRPSTLELAWNPT